MKNSTKYADASGVNYGNYLKAQSIDSSSFWNSSQSLLISETSTRLESVFSSGGCEGKGRICYCVMNQKQFGSQSGNTAAKSLCDTRAAGHTARRPRSCLCPGRPGPLRDAAAADLQAPLQRTARPGKYKHSTLSSV